MKAFLIFLSVFFVSALFSNELSWVDEQVQAIKPPRSGMKQKNISKIKDPFIFLLKNRDEGEEIVSSEKSSLKIPTKTVATNTNAKTPKVKTVNKILSIGMIMNKSAFISGAWYKIGDIVNGYTVSDISPKNVLLTKNKKELLLSTKSINKKLKFQK